MPIIIIPSLASLPFSSATFSLLSPLEGIPSINVTSDHYMFVELLRFKQASGFATLVVAFPNLILNELF